MSELRLDTMLPEDAEKCWCPFARSLVTAKNGDTGEVTAMAGVNRSSAAAVGGTDDVMAPCISTRCMAWRWEAGSYVSPHHGGMIVRRVPNEWDASRGFCGLAGAPLP